MNDNKKTKTKTKTKTTKTIIAAATIMVVVASAAMILGMQTQMSQYALAQTYGTTAAASAGSASNPIIVNPSQTTNKEFWINTVHLDGATSLHPAVANPNSAQNTPLHPGETPPVNRHDEYLPIFICGNNFIYPTFNYYLYL
jgi:hypothetical protein